MNEQCSSQVNFAPPVNEPVQEQARFTALWLRDFWHYDAATDPHVLAERERRAAYDEVDSRTPDAD